MHRLNSVAPKGAMKSLASLSSWRAAESLASNLSTRELDRASIPLVTIKSGICLLDVHQTQFIANGYLLVKAGILGIAESDIE